MADFNKIREMPTEDTEFNLGALPDIASAVTAGNMGRAVFKGIEGLVPEDGAAIIVDSALALRGRVRLSGETEIAGQDVTYASQAYVSGSLDGFDAGVQGHVNFGEDLGDGLSVRAGGEFNFSLNDQRVGASAEISQSVVGDEKFSWQADAGFELSHGNACGSISGEVKYGQTAGVFGRAAAGICTNGENGIGFEAGVHTSLVGIGAVAGTDLSGSFAGAIVSEVQLEAGVRIGSDNVYEESRSFGTGGDVTPFVRANLGF